MNLLKHLIPVSKINRSLFKMKFTTNNRRKILFF